MPKFFTYTVQMDRYNNVIICGELHPSSPVIRPGYTLHHTGDYNSCLRVKDQLLGWHDPKEVNRAQA